MSTEKIKHADGTSGFRLNFRAGTYGRRRETVKVRLHDAASKTDAHKHASGACAR